MGVPFDLLLFPQALVKGPLLLVADSPELCNWVVFMTLAEVLNSLQTSRVTRGRNSLPDTASTLREALSLPTS